MPSFGCHRTTTDKGEFMELRVWFRRLFSVADVHWQKRVEKGGRDEKKGALIIKVHGGLVFTYIRFRHIHMQLCLIIQKSCCFIQQFSKKCIILSGDKTLDLSCEGMISHIEDHSTFFHCVWQTFCLLEPMVLPQSGCLHARIGGQKNQTGVEKWNKSRRKKGRRRFGETRYSRSAQYGW